jgi:VanZ family protein
MSRRVALVALVVYVGALAALTLGESPAAALRWTTDALQHEAGFRSVTVQGVERTANVLLFVPAGLLLCYAFPRTPRLLVWALCVVVSAGAEAAQYFLPDRDATLVDVLTNATGAAIGVLLHAALSRRSVRSR